MKYLISIFAVVFFLTTIVFTQAQEKQQVKKEVKVEKVQKDDCCSTEKASEKTKKESCDTEKSKSKSEDDDCCKSEKSSTKNKR